MEALVLADMEDARRSGVDAAAADWRMAAAVVASMLVWAGAWYWDTGRAMVQTWGNSATYAHGFFVAPISAWLIWRERHRLAQLRPSHDLRVLPLLLLPGAAWLLGDLANVRVVQEFALVGTIVLAVWALLGSAVTKALAFPLLFLLFAVPAGDFLLPALMEYTARFTVLALQLTGVPVYREGMSIAVPTGNWSVVEACSGLRYLIACFTGGVLFAYLRYRRLGRRLAFVVAAAIVPVVANWLRAYVIVMIGEISGGRIAAGVDHLLYGWVFFAIVTVLLFGIASVWREDAGPDAAATHAARGDGARPHSRNGWLVVGVATAAAIAVWPAAAWHLEDRPPTAPGELSVPDAGEWHVAAGRLTDWTPDFVAPTVVQQTFAKGTSRAGLYMAYYRDQRRGAELVSSMNSLAPKQESWRVVEEFVRETTVSGVALSAVETHLDTPSGRLVVWRWYWVDGARTTSPYRAKLLQLRSQLQGRGDDAAVVMLYAPAAPHAADALALLRDFAGAALPGINQALDHARAR